MPETFGKRQRQTVKERKAAAREERRRARGQRRDDRAAGLIPPGPPQGPPEGFLPEELGAVGAQDPGEESSSDSDRADSAR